MSIIFGTHTVVCRVTVRYWMSNGREIKRIFYEQIMMKFNQVDECIRRNQLYYILLSWLHFLWNIHANMKTRYKCHLEAFSSCSMNVSIQVVCEGNGYLTDDAWQILSNLISTILPLLALCSLDLEQIHSYSFNIPATNWIKRQQFLQLLHTHPNSVYTNCV